jgi:tetratricopeptide (TPR) repeat protein
MAHLPREVLRKPILLVFLVFAFAIANSTADIVRAQDFAYRQEYDSALAVTSAAIAADSSDPAAYYWQAAILQLLINDSGRGWLADSFFALSDRAIALCRQRLARNGSDARAHLYYGMTQIGRASLLGFQQRLVPALRVLPEVAPHLNVALGLDSSLTDARFGLGMMEYFMATSDRYLPGLRLGSRRKAYSLIQPVADGVGVRKPAAQLMIAFMLKEDRHYDDALGYCWQVLTAYPGNRSALRLMRDILFGARRYADVVRVGAEIDSALLKAFPDNRYGLAQNWVVCGEAHALLGEKQKARELFNRVIAWEPYQAGVPWLPQYVLQAKRWRARLGR